MGDFTLWCLMIRGESFSQNKPNVEEKPLIPFLLCLSVEGYTLIKRKCTKNCMFIIGTHLYSMSNDLLTNVVNYLFIPEINAK